MTDKPDIREYMIALEDMGEMLMHGGILRLACISRFMDIDMLDRYTPAFVGLQKAGFIRYKEVLANFEDEQDQVWLAPVDDVTLDAIKAYEGFDLDILVNEARTRKLVASDPSYGIF